MGLMTYDGYASPRSTAAFVASEAFLGHGAPQRILLDGAGWETVRNCTVPSGVAAAPSNAPKASLYLNGEHISTTGGSYLQKGTILTCKKPALGVGKLTGVACASPERSPEGPIWNTRGDQLQAQRTILIVPSP